MGLPSGSELLATIGGNSIYEYLFNSRYDDSLGEEVFEATIYNQNSYGIQSLITLNSVFSLSSIGVVNSNFLFDTSLGSTYTLYGITRGAAETLVSWQNVATFNVELQLNSAFLIYEQSTSGVGYLYTSDGSSGLTSELVEVSAGDSVVNYVSYSDGYATNFVSSGVGAVFEVVTGSVSGGQFSYNQTKIYEINSTGNGASLVATLNGVGAKYLPNPLVTQGGGVSVSYGGSAGVSGLSVLEINAGSSAFTVKLTASNGTLTTSGGQGSVGGAGTSTLTLSGSFSQVNADLAELSFRGTHVGAGSISAVASFGGATSATETSSATVTGSPPVVANATPGQSVAAGQHLSFQIPADTFSDPQGEGLSFAASLANGGALPSWLTFSAVTDTFSGNAPALGPQSLSIKLTATDTSGLSVSETFGLSLTAPAPPALSITSTGGLVNHTAQTITGTIDPGDAGLTVSILDGTTVIGTATPAADGAWSASVTLPPIQGAQSITAKATDVAGDAGASGAVTYDLLTVVSVAQLTADAAAIADLHNPGGAPVTLTVEDTTVDLSDGVMGTLQADPEITSIVVSDNGASGNGFVRLSVAQLEADSAALSDLVFADGQTAGTVKVADTAADDIAALSLLNGDTQVGRINVTDDGAIVVSVAQLTSDARAVSILHHSDGTPVTVTASDTAVNLSDAALGVIQANPEITSVVVSDDGASGNGFVRQSVAQLEADAGALSELVFADGQTLGTVKIADTAADDSAALNMLNADTQVGRINVTDDGAIVVTVAQLTSDARAISILHHSDGTPVTMTASDTAMNLSDAELGLIQANPEITSVVVSDDGASGNGFLRLSVAQLQADAAILSKLVFADGQTAGTVKIADTAADDTAALNLLNGDSQVGRINVTDDGAIVVSVAQLITDATAIGELHHSDGTPVTLEVEDTTADFNGASINGFTTAGDILDLTEIAYAKLTASFTENAAGTAGQLTLSDGTHRASITLFGQYMAGGFSGTAAAAGFAAASDGAAGTKLTYTPVAAPH